MADNFNAKNWRDLIKPRKLEVDADSLTNTYGKFVAEPLERGFGTTLGNSVRRVLLSSLQGAAITSVKIDGVEHEFTTISEVSEDVTDVVLNLKEVLLRMHTNEPKVLKIEVEGPKVKVIHSLTSMGCPVGPMIQEEMHAVVAAMSPDVEDVEIELTWDPPWTPDRMSEDAKFILGFG